MLGSGNIRTNHLLAAMGRAHVEPVFPTGTTGQSSAVSSRTGRVVVGRALRAVAATKMN